MHKELGYLLVAAGTSAVALAPMDLHEFPMDARLRPLMEWFAVAWVGIRLGVFLSASERWRRWRQAPRWTVRAEDLPFESCGRWLPRPLALYLYRCMPRRAVRFLYRDRGILLGHAFQWSKEHTQELENYLHTSSKPLPMGRDSRLGYPALHAVGIRNEKPLVLAWSDLTGHALFGGTTRSGKTRLLEVVLAEAIRGPGTVVAIDPKGDAELFIRAAYQARLMKRPFAFFSPAFPEESASFNPLGACETPSEVATRVQSLMPGGGAMGKDPFFTEYPLAIVERLAEAQKAVGERWTIEGLHAVTTLAEPLKRLVAKYLQEVVFEDDGPRRDLDSLLEDYRGQDVSDRLADELLDDVEKSREYFQKVTANLTPAFRGVTGYGMDKLLSSPAPELTWDGIVKDRTVVYFSMNSLMFGEVANRIGRVILQDLIGFLGRRYAYDDPAAMSPITILVDEFSNIAYPGFVDALNKGGGARAQFMLAMQSLADPEAAMQRDGTQRVLDNLGTRVWFRLADDATAKLATEALGFTSVRREDISYSLNFGGDSAVSAASRGAMREAEVQLFRSEWLTGMPTGEALVRRRGENWKLRVPLLKPVSKKEMRALAGEYGLEKVIAEFRRGVGPRSPASPKAAGSAAGLESEMTGSQDRMSERSMPGRRQGERTVPGGSLGVKAVADELARVVNGGNGAVPLAEEDGKGVPGGSLGVKAVADELARVVNGSNGPVALAEEDEKGSPE